MVVEAVHCLEAEDHVQAVGEDEQHEQGGEQPHPDTRGEEACTVASIGELLACHIEGLDLEVPKSHLPKRGLCVRHKEAAILVFTADMLAVEGINAGPRDLGGIEVGDGTVAMDFQVLQGKPVPGRYPVEAVSQSELERHHGPKE